MKIVIGSMNYEMELQYGDVVTFQDGEILKVDILAGTTIEEVSSQKPIASVERDE